MQRTTPYHGLQALFFKDVLTANCFLTLYPQANVVNQILLEKFAELVSARVGWRIRAEDRASFAKTLAARVRVLGLQSLDRYYQLLAETSDRAASPGDREWQQLLEQLTNGETYFFRDRGQVSVLRDQLLPRLIASQRLAFEQGKSNSLSLRLWSAGCSTGEEVYTLAILVRELIPDLDRWQISILGTDLNSESIAKAKRGIYGKGAFRNADPATKPQYFRQHRDGWEVLPAIRDRIAFELGNLLADRFPTPNSAIAQMDLIICRNVFIYFNFEAIARILNKFYATLEPGGYLLAGHSELAGQDMSQYQILSFESAVVYKRPALEEAPLQGPSPPPSSAPTPKARSPRASSVAKTNTRTAPRARTSPQQRPRKTAVSRPETPVSPAPSLAIEQLRGKLARGDYAGVIQQAQQHLASQPPVVELLELMGLAYASQGNYDSATQCGQKMQAIAPNSVRHLYLLAQIAEDRGHLKEAKSLLKQALYLDPDAIIAYLELGAIHESEGDAARAAKMRATAMQLLKQRPPEETIVSHRGAIAVEELLRQLKKMLPD